MITLHADTLGQYQCTESELTAAISTYLPAGAERIGSVVEAARLRAIAEDRTDGDTDLSGVPLGGLLIILADLDHELAMGAVPAGQ